MERRSDIPREAGRLLREVDAAIRIKDIQEWQQLRERVEVKWWESALIALLFISGIGILVTIAMLIPRDVPMLYYFILGWAGLWVLTLVSCVEFLIGKFRALRRMHEVTDRLMRRMEVDLDEARATLKALADKPRPDSGD